MSFFDFAEIFAQKVQEKLKMFDAFKFQAQIKLAYMLALLLPSRAPILKARTSGFETPTWRFPRN